MGLGWYDYGARMYDPAVGRFFTQDRFAEKYSPMSPYQYAANNPILYIDVNGDSLDVGSIMSNPMLGKVFELFAQSDDGREFLSQFASKGQTLYGHTFEKDGAFHSEGINLSVNATESADDLKIPGGAKNGETDFQQTESGLNIEININSYLNADGLYSSDAATELRSTSNAYSQGNATAEELRAARRGFWFDRLSTLAHESYQHAERFASSYTSGGSTLLNSRTKREWGILHHSLEGRNQTTNFQTKGLRILQSANSQLKLGYNRSRILDTMY